MKSLYLIDAYAMIFRAYYSMGSNFLYNSKGLNVTAINGFTRTIWQLIQKEKPEHIAVVFDFKGKTFRSEEFEYYKANRDATPEDIIISEPYIRQIIQAMHIPILEKEGYEADDVIGTLAKKYSKMGYEVFMVTPDKDFAQLVEEHIKIYKPPRSGGQEEILGVKEVCEQWEISDPLQVIDILALWGDAVDNIPGIPGIGEKTAKSLIQKYGSVENLIAHSDELKGKQKENVVTFAQQGLDSKKLATIITDLPIEVTEEQLVLDPFDKDALRSIFSELEFRTLQRDILDTPGISPNVKQTQSNKATQPDLFNQDIVASEQEIATPFESIKDVEHSYTLVNDENLQELLNHLDSCSAFCFDTETTGLDFINDKIVGISFSFESHKAYYLPLLESDEHTQSTLDKFSHYFTSKDKIKIAHNIKFDGQMLYNYGIKILPPFYDTMISHFMLDSDSKQGMDYLSQRYLNYQPISFENLVGKGRQVRDIRDVPIDQVLNYAAEDADVTYQLYTIFDEKIKTEEKVNQVFHQVDLPLIPVLGAMERHGVTLDVEFLKNYSLELSAELDTYREKIYQEAGMQFNLDSPKQLGEVLFQKLKIPYSGKKTKTGQYSTGEDVLNYLRKNYPIAHDITEYRELTKLKSTYVDALPNLINPKTGRIHTSYNQTIASTGRLSSTNPNLQNIPIRTERGRQIRKAFVAPNEDFLIMSADYSQIELRIMADMSGDKTMLDAFKNNQDIHQLTASKVYGVPMDEVTREQRSNAKVVNFGIIYGVSAFGLAQQTNLSQSEAKEMIQNYFKTYPQIGEFMELQKELGHKYGYVETILGRRRYLRDINSRNQMMRGMYERIAINAPVQGSAADLIKLAMIHIFDQMKEANMKSRMTMQVHDELVFEIHKDELDVAKKMIIESMEHAMPELTVPIIAESGVGQNWLEAH